MVTFDQFNVSLLNISIHLNLCVYLFELHHGESEQIDKLLLVLTDTDTCDLSQTLQSDVSEHRNIQKLWNTSEHDKSDFWNTSDLQGYTCWSTSSDTKLWAERQWEQPVLQWFPSLSYAMASWTNASAPLWEVCYNSISLNQLSYN